MSESKIEINVAGIVFSGQGEQTWLSEQLNKILEAATELSKLQPAPSATGAPVAKNSAAAPASTGSVGTLASHVKSKGGETNQVKRFLATADWLRLRGETLLTTAKVSKALSDNHQKRLGNPADALNHNVRKGHCEKKDGGFFITPEGLSELGHPS